MNQDTRLSSLDKFIVQFDQALRTLVPGSSQAGRTSPGETIEEQSLSESERKHAAALMRINHTGEVCAQALYQGQALTAKLPEVRAAMNDAANEEIDHLAWCEQRLHELDSHSSILNPVWYAMSFGLGAVAGIAGDKWSLGFVAETEQQVCNHLQDHLEKLPEQDDRSRAVLQQMLIDERNHGETARLAGGAELPVPIRQLMAGMSAIMKKLVYQI